MSILFMFPGQGSQHTGMLYVLPGDLAVAQILTEVGDVLGVDPLMLDTVEALWLTVAVQLCLLIAGVAAARTLARQDAGPNMVAGLSIGAWPAVAVASVLDFSDALRLVRLRGQLMGDAYPGGYGMAVTTGLTEPETVAVVTQVNSAATPAYVANLNAERQTVVVDSDVVFTQVMAHVQATGASTATRLRMAVPSHCPLLGAQAGELATAAAKITAHAPQLACVSSSRARALFRASLIVKDLAWNMARPVLWHDTLRHALERGARMVVEVPGGGTLARLAQDMFTDGAVLDVGAGRDAVRVRIQRQRRGNGL